MSRASLFRKERRRRGLCAVAGCPVVTGDRSYRCHAHAEAHRGAMKLAYQAEIARRMAEAALLAGPDGPPARPPAAWPPKSLPHERWAQFAAWAAEGLPQTEMALRAGISRQAVSALLARMRGHGEQAA